MIQMTLFLVYISLGMSIGLLYRVRYVEKEIVRLKSELYLLSSKIESK